MEDFLACAIIMGGMFVLAFLGWLSDRKKWRKQSWEGVVIGKYWYISNSKYTSVKKYCVEVCYDQTVKVKEIFGNERWKSIEIGDYVIKKSGSDSIEKRATQEEEARKVRHVLTQRLSHERRGIRSRAAEALRQIGTPEAIEAVKKWS